MRRRSCAETGRAGEEIARLFLEAHGVVVLGCRQRTPGGEIDIVGREGAETVFVEVKARSGRRMGSGEESLDGRRVRRLRAAAAYWLANVGLAGPPACRFDLVVIHVDATGRPLRLVWHRAFID